MDGAEGIQLQLPICIKNSLVQKDKQEKSDKFIIQSIIILHSRKLESYFRNYISTYLVCFPVSAAICFIAILLLCPVV